MIDEGKIRFALVLHAHQPTGNFDFVFRENFDKCYSPLLEKIEAHPAVPVGLHFSGILLEWLEANEPAFLDRLRAVVDKGQVELLGGGFGEPILVMLTDEDRRRQIETMSRWLEERFGEAPRGAWLTERVWEQSLAHDMANARIEYTLVDDSHLKLCGVRGNDLDAVHVTEDRGGLLRIYPLSERLRYLIPFHEPGETIDFLKERADRSGKRLLVYGDDAEKFGAWPGTFDHVFQNGWLERFLTALEENRAWIDLIRPCEALRLETGGKIYMPDASYREMTEWALPTAARLEHEELTRKLGDLADSAAVFFRGGNWRTFLAKYPESSEMYGRTLDVSRRVRALPDSMQAKWEAELELFRAQCNCAYWHGVLGGLYLPHLRFAVYEKLLSAGRIIEDALRETAQWVDLRRGDMDMDGNEEIRLTSDRLGLTVHPERGGHLIEIDDRRRRINLTAGMTRRLEAYHREVRRAAEEAAGDHPNGDGVASIHDRSVLKEGGLEEQLVYDDHKRESLVDRFLVPGAGIDDVAAADRSVERGDFVEGRYAVEERIDDDGATVVLRRRGVVATDGGNGEVVVRKEIGLRPGERTFAMRYEIENIGAVTVDAGFSVEFNLALLAGDAHDRRLFSDSGDLGPLSGKHDLRRVTLLGARDEYLGVSAGIVLSRSARGWIFPIRTVSLSEGGFESVYQSSVIMPVWGLHLEGGGKWDVVITGFVLSAGEESAHRGGS